MKPQISVRGSLKQRGKKKKMNEFCLCFSLIYPQQIITCLLFSHLSRMYRKGLVLSYLWHPEPCLTINRHPTNTQVSTCFIFTWNMWKTEVKDKDYHYYFSPYYSVQFSSVAQSYPNLCNPMDCSMTGLPVHH